MKNTWMRLAAAVIVMAAIAAPAFAVERMSDKQVKEQGKIVKTGFEAWKKALEKQKLANATITNATGTIDVKEFINSFEKDIDTFNDKFDSTKNGGPEALVLLRRASDVERRNRAQGSKVPSEWAALVTQLSALASAYGVTFPIETMDAQLGRVNDTELITQLAEVERLAKRLQGQAEDATKKANASDKAAAKAAGDAIKIETDKLATMAKVLGDKVKNGQASSAEATAILAAIKKYGEGLTALQLSQPAKTDWASIEKAAGVIARAYGEK